MVPLVPVRARTRIDQRHGTLGVWRRALLMVILAVTGLALPAIGAGSVVSAEETTTTESTTTTTEAPTTTESTTTTTQAPTTTESTTTTTAQTQQGGVRQVPVPTTSAPSSTTSSTTPSSTSTTSTTVVKSGAIVPGSKGSKSGGLSTGFKVLLVVIGLVAVAAGFMALSVIYWRHTRPALASGVDAGAADLA